MSDANRPYMAYSDEAYTGERFQSLCLITIRPDLHDTYQDQLRAIVGDLAEFKWQSTRDHRHFNVAKQFIDWAVQRVGTHELRIDNLIWDM